MWRGWRVSEQQISDFQWRFTHLHLASSLIQVAARLVEGGHIFRLRSAGAKPAFGSGLRCVGDARGRCESIDRSQHADRTDRKNESVLHSRISRGCRGHKERSTERVVRLLGGKSFSTSVIDFYARSKIDICRRGIEIPETRRKKPGSFTRTLGPQISLRR
jgi:hypothetical protein